MPASKRRRAAASRRTQVPAEPAAPVAGPVAADDAPAARPRPQPRRASTSTTDPDAEPRWDARGFATLLGLAFLVQLPIGAITHVIAKGNLLIIDLFFFQPQWVLLGCLLTMPLARRVARQPRPLRLLESLSIGAVYALLALLLATVFVHPSGGSLSTDQFIKQLTVNDGLRIAFADVLALAGAVALFPSVNRLLGAPGRRARRRMVERSARGSRPPSLDRRRGGPTKPRR